MLPTADVASQPVAEGPGTAMSDEPTDDGSSLQSPPVNQAELAAQERHYGRGHTIDVTCDASRGSMLDRIAGTLCCSGTGRLRGPRPSQRSQYGPA